MKKQDDIYDLILKDIYWKLPPLAMIILLPIAGLISISYPLVKIALWLLGFWECDDCKKVKWNQFKAYEVGGRFSERWVCEKCWHNNKYGAI